MLETLVLLHFVLLLSVPGIRASAVVRASAASALTAADIISMSFKHMDLCMLRVSVMLVTRIVDGEREGRWSLDHSHSSTSVVVLGLVSKHCSLRFLCEPPWSGSGMPCRAINEVGAYGCFW